jgi:hypothetical protein
MAVEDLVSAGNTLMGCVEPANGLLNGVRYRVSLAGDVKRDKPLTTDA